MPTTSEMERESIEDSDTPPSAVRVIFRAFEIMQARTARESTQATVTISPELGEIPSGKLRNFGGGTRYVDAGDAAFEAALPRIAAVLPWLRAP
jgi:hypothetical protein